MRPWVLGLVMLGCGDDVSVPENTEPLPEIGSFGPEFTACLTTTPPDGHPLSNEACACIVAIDDRPFGESTNWSEVQPSDSDPRFDDPAYAYWADAVRATPCGCCHDSAFRGSGTPFWAVSHTPVWIDSASDDRLRVMAGLDRWSGQTVPFRGETMRRFREFVERELAWRASAR